MFQTTNQILVYWRVRDVVWRKASGIPSEEGRQHACTKIRKRGHIGWNLRAEWHVGSNGFTIWLIMFLHMISSSHFSITESCFLDTTPTIYWVMINNAVSIASKWTQKSSNIKNMLCHPKTVYGIIMNIPGTQMVFGHGHWPILIRIMLWNYRPLQMVPIVSLSCPYLSLSWTITTSSSGTQTKWFVMIRYVWLVALLRSSAKTLATVHRPEMTRSQRGSYLIYIITVESNNWSINPVLISMICPYLSRCSVWSMIVYDRWLSMQSQTSPWKPWSK